MLSGPKQRIAAGMVLLAIASLGLAVAGGRWHLRETRRHVVVKLSNVDGVEQVFINCHLATRLESGESGKTVDLGWLEPDDRVFLSTISIDSSPAWSFSGTVNGGFLFHESRGSTGLPRFETTAHAVVFAQAFLADGTEVGAIGCQAPKSAAEDLVALEGYAWSPDDRKVSPVTDARSSYRQPNDFYDRVDAIGGWSLAALAVAGAIAAVATPSIRRFAWAHKGSLAAGALALLEAGFFGVGLPTMLTAVGVLLLFVVAILLVLGGAVSLRCNREMDALGNTPRT